MRPANASTTDLYAITGEQLEMIAVDAQQSHVTGVDVMRQLIGRMRAITVVPGEARAIEAAAPGAVAARLEPLVVLPIEERHAHGSMAARWAGYVIKACESDGDLKTLASWARFVGVSYTTLCESCRILGLRPHEARDLMRALRALLQAQAYDCPPDVLLDLSDRRTLRAFLRRSGEAFRRGVGLGLELVDPFLQHQSFVPGHHVAVATLRALIHARLAGGWTPMPVTPSAPNGLSRLAGAR